MCEGCYHNHFYSQKILFVNANSKSQKDCILKPQFPVRCKQELNIKESDYETKKKIKAKSFQE